MRAECTHGHALAREDAATLATSPPSPSRGRCSEGRRRPVWGNAPDTMLEQRAAAPAAPPPLAFLYFYNPKRGGVPAPIKTNARGACANFKMPRGCLHPII